MNVKIMFVVNINNIYQKACSSCDENNIDKYTFQGYIKICDHALFILVKIRLVTLSVSFYTPVNLWQFFYKILLYRIILYIIVLFL